MNKTGSSDPKDWRWRFWATLPLYPYRKRRTLLTEVIPETIWTFDQIQGILYTVVPIRMTIVKLATGGLLAYAPVAPTAECIQLVNQLVAQHGPVKYIIFPSSSGLEHKIFVGPFARHFPQAQVFVAPNQWSFPINLPLSWLGFPGERTQVLPEDSSQAPFASDFDYAVLSIDLGQGAFSEAAFLHRRSKTLLVTDAVVAIPAEPPAIVQLDPYPLLFHARDTVFEPIEDTLANRRKGWQRIALFSMYFRPSALEPVDFGQTIRNAFKARNRSKQAYFGLYPFRWQPDWQESFWALQGNGRLFVAPILQTLIFPQAPQKTLDWVDRISSWDFERIMPCHLATPISANGLQFRQAFQFLTGNVAKLSERDTAGLPPIDFDFIKSLEATLVKLGIAKPAKEL